VLAASAVTDTGFPAASNTASNVYSGVIKMMWKQPVGDRWALSSIAYKRVDDDMYLKVRAGEYTGSGSSAATLTSSADAFYESGELNPTRSQDSNDGTTAWYWNGNFVRFSAKYSVTDLTGIYSAAWVAGSGQEDARIFNLKMQNSTSPSGLAFFGFGSPVQDPNFDALVAKFYCNWTAVGGTNGGNTSDTVAKGMINGSQYQSFALQTSGIWRPTVNNLSFAPTRSCNKTGAVTTDGAQFKYSREWSSMTNSMKTTDLADSIATHNLLGKDTYTTYKDRVKAMLGWSSASLVP
jgi:hypothetical protein